MNGHRPATGGNMRHAHGLTGAATHLNQRRYRFGLLDVVDDAGLQRSHVGKSLQQHVANVGFVVRGDHPTNVVFGIITNKGGGADAIHDFAHLISAWARNA